MNFEAWCAIARGQKKKPTTRSTRDRGGNPQPTDYVVSFEFSYSNHQKYKDPLSVCQTLIHNSAPAAKLVSWIVELTETPSTPYKLFAFNFLMLRNCRRFDFFQSMINEALWIFPCRLLLIPRPNRAAEAESSKHLRNRTSAQNALHAPAASSV